MLGIKCQFYGWDYLTDENKCLEGGDCQQHCPKQITTDLSCHNCGVLSPLCKRPNDYYYCKDCENIMTETVLAHEYNKLIKIYNGQVENLDRKFHELNKRHNQVIKRTQRFENLVQQLGMV